MKWLVYWITTPHSLGLIYAVEKMIWLLDLSFSREMVNQRVIYLPNGSTNLGKLW